MATILEAAAYAAGQAARVAWYTGHHLTARRLGGPATSVRASEGPKLESRPPSRREFAAAILELFERDWSNIQAGLYQRPSVGDNPLKLIAKARAFLADAPRVEARRRAGAHSEVMTEERRAKYPRYYLQNFHYQTDGWFSGESARIYDFQVETLFAGTADAMRRQALAPLARHLRGRDQRTLKMLDVACGTGRFLAQVKSNWPLLNVTGLDMSPAYVAQAGHELESWRAVKLVEADASAMPIETVSQDFVTCIYLFHELPPKIRATVAAEIARVLKPGGRLALVDSVQPRDGRGFDALTEFFPQVFHEPYYSSYLEWRAEDAFASAGLRKLETLSAFLSTVHVFEKPN